MKKRCQILVLTRHMLILRPDEGLIIIDKSGKADKLSMQRKKRCLHSGRDECRSGDRSYKPCTVKAQAQEPAPATINLETLSHEKTTAPRPGC